MLAAVTIVIAALGSAAAVTSAVVSAYAARQSQVASTEANAASREAAASAAAMAAVDADRRRDERTPQLGGVLHLDRGGARSSKVSCTLAVWLESAEPLADLRIEIQEIADVGCPIGFVPGQAGVPDPAGTPEADFVTRWDSANLRPAAEWGELLPGHAAAWAMQRRPLSRGGPEAIRFSAVATAASDGQAWTLPLPVTPPMDLARILGQFAHGAY